MSAKELVVASRGSSLDAFHDFAKRGDFAVLIEQETENEMHVIGHDDDDIDRDSLSVGVQCMSKRDRSGTRRKHPSVDGRESHEERSFRRDDMWKVAAIEGLEFLTAFHPPSFPRSVGSRLVVPLIVEEYQQSVGGGRRQIVIRILHVERENGTDRNVCAT
jgi:hypothetical protein